MAKVYDYVDMSCLPDEYLPDDYDGPSAGPAKQIIGKNCFNFWQADYAAFVTCYLHIFLKKISYHMTLCLGVI